MSRLTPDARQAANVDAYKAALSMFWGNMTALEQIVEEDFPDGANETIAPTRYQVDAIRDLGNRVGALVEGYIVDGSVLGVWQPQYNEVVAALKL
jgi:hypothetical protein